MTVALGVVIALASGLTLAVVHSLVTEEARAWLPHLAQRLVRSAARRLPRDERDRYEHEWLAELAAWRDRPLSALLKAASIRWHARAMRSSLGGSAEVSVLDRIVAGLVLFAVAPLIGMVAIIIRLESKGPVFMRLPTTGRSRDRPVLFFRTVRMEAVAQPDGRFLLPMTRFGRLLHRTDLMWLPRLFDTVRGHEPLLAAGASWRDVLRAPFDRRAPHS